MKFLILSMLLALLPATLPGVLEAQTPGPTGARQARDVQPDLLRFLNDPATLRLVGGGRIPAGARVDAPVGVLGGSLVLGGTIAGDLVVVNGDLRVEPGARVEGDVTVVGGSILGGSGEPWVTGTLRLDPAPLRYRIRDDRVEAEPAPVELPRILVADFGAFEVRPLLRAAGAYNRVEGLPVEIGGTLELRSRNPLRVDVGAIWRSASGLEMERENLGYLFQAEQAVGGRGEARIGFTAHREIQPIETRDMSNLESALSTFLLRRDLRDHYAREGWSVYLEASPVDLPLRPRFEYREEDHRVAEVRAPWTLRSAERDWRPQPIVAEGAVRTLAVSLSLDTRDDPVDPSDGWWVQGRLRRQVGGNPALPETVATNAAGSFDLATDGHLDFRRYNRIGPEMRLNSRLLVSGAMNGVALLPQFQRALGGEGTLPGHPRFAMDCGARSEAVQLNGTGGDVAPGPFYPAYGCDGVALARVEFQGPLPLAWRPGDSLEDWELASLLELRPAWSLFLGAGKGWSYPDSGNGDTRVDAPVRADMGVGFFVGPLGLYWAWPLNRRDRGVNFFVRLSHLF
ncbi:hypothetical protein BH23GEM11_BH23GEM11_08270 [soil metagenome]